MIDDRIKIYKSIARMFSEMKDEVYPVEGTVREIETYIETVRKEEYRKALNDMKDTQEKNESETEKVRTEEETEEDTEFIMLSNYSKEFSSTIRFNTDVDIYRLLEYVKGFVLSMGFFEKTWEEGVINEYQKLELDQED